MSVTARRGWPEPGRTSKIAAHPKRTHGDSIVMKHYITALMLAGALAAAQANAACNYPVAPGKFPDGNQATKEEMLAAKGQVVQYNTDMETYLNCIQGE